MEAEIEATLFEDEVALLLAKTKWEYDIFVVFEQLLHYWCLQFLVCLGNADYLIGHALEILLLNMFSKLSHLELTW